MRVFVICGVGILCAAALGVPFSGCQQSGTGEKAVNVQNLDAFTQAMAYAKTGDVSNLKSLIAANPDLVKERSADGMTLLHYAAIVSQADVVKLLIDNGADVNASDNSDHQTPLQAAESEHASEAVTKLLRDAGGQ